MSKTITAYPKARITWSHKHGYWCVELPGLFARSVSPSDYPASVFPSRDNIVRAALDKAGG